MKFNALLSLLTATGVFASPVPADLEERATLEERASEINHDAVQWTPGAVSNDAAGRAMARFQPTLLSVKDCWAFPAVVKDGNWSGGLNPSGSKTGGCCPGPLATPRTTSTGARPTSS